MVFAIQSLKFDERGLIPAIVQDSRTNEILTLAYMNAESLARTLQTGETWFWSRSRQELWHKGETSGNFQHVVDIRIDCDGDALIVLVDPEGPACHLGEQTCFHRNLAEETQERPLLRCANFRLRPTLRDLSILHQSVAFIGRKRWSIARTTRGPGGCSSSSRA